jgi:hypothetical protein
MPAVDNLVTKVPDVFKESRTNFSSGVIVGKSDDHGDGTSNLPMFGLFMVGS